MRAIRNQRGRIPLAMPFPMKWHLEIPRIIPVIPVSAQPYAGRFRFLADQPSLIPIHQVPSSHSHTNINPIHTKCQINKLKC
jgi:hypothetical protein